jgi:hypothetical protein
MRGAGHAAQPADAGAGAGGSARPLSSPLLAPGERSPGHVSEAAVQAWLPRCRALPKAELHAHINGCVRDATIRCGWSALPQRAHDVAAAPARCPRRAAARCTAADARCAPRRSELAAARADDAVIQREAHRLTHRGAHTPRRAQHRVLATCTLTHASRQAHAVRLLRALRRHPPADHAARRGGAHHARGGGGLLRRRRALSRAAHDAQSASRDGGADHGVTALRALRAHADAHCWVAQVNAAADMTKRSYIEAVLRGASEGGGAPAPVAWRSLRALTPPRRARHRRGAVRARRRRRQRRHHGASDPLHRPTRGCAAAAAARLRVVFPRIARAHACGLVIGGRCAPRRLGGGAGDGCAGCFAARPRRRRGRPVRQPLAGRLGHVAAGAGGGAHSGPAAHAALRRGAQR